MILYVLRYYPTATETFVHDEIRGLRAAGLPIELAAFDAREGGTDPPPAPFHPQPHGRGWWAALPALIQERSYGAAPKRVLWLASLLRRRGVRRVHVHFAGEAAGWARDACARVQVPYSVTVHATDLYRPHPRLEEILHGAVEVVTISRYNQEHLAALGVGATLIRCGVDLFPGPAGAGTRVLSVGRWVPKKGLDLLAEAAAVLKPNPPFVLYSDAPALPGIEVRGLRPHAEVLVAYRDAVVFVLPCRIAADGDRDGIPVAILEALAAGVAVITTAVAGIPEVVDDEVGWLLPPEDPSALVQALREVASDPALARERGARGPDRLRERGFDRADTLRAMLRVLTLVDWPMRG